MGVTSGGPYFQVDDSVWTCPECGHTFRSWATTPGRRAAQRRAVREAHKCDDPILKVLRR